MDQLSRSSPVQEDVDNKKRFYIAISDDGEVILGSNKLQVDLEALARFGSGHYAFRRIGLTFEGSWRRAP